MNDFKIRILYRIGNKARGHLIDNHNSLAVGSHFAQHFAEHRRTIACGLPIPLISFSAFF
jgi:hypothetical protein